MILAEKQKIMFLVTFSGVQVPLKAGTASPFLRHSSEEPCALLESRKSGKSVGRRSRLL